MTEVYTTNITSNITVFPINTGKPFLILGLADADYSMYVTFSSLKSFFSKCTLNMYITTGSFNSAQAGLSGYRELQTSFINHIPKASTRAEAGTPHFIKEGNDLL